MRKTLSIISLVLLLAFPLAATSYPTLSTTYELGKGEVVPLEQEVLEAFIQEWQDRALPTFEEADQMLRKAIDQGNLNLDQLQSLYRMQQAQLEYQKGEQGFKFGLSSTPLYSLSRTPLYGMGGTLSFDTKHTFGLGASVSTKLATGASATLSVKQSSTYAMNSSTSTAWKWINSPSVGLTVAQPLWIGDGLLDTSYGEKQLEKQSIAVQGSRLSFEQLKSALVSQGNSLLVALQALMEGRFLLGEQLILEQASLKDAQKDLTEGRISRNAYEAKALALNQLRFSLSEIESQIEGILSSLTLLWGSDKFPIQVALDSALFKTIPTLVFDKGKLLALLLENDPSYALAMGKLRSAELEANLKNPADAPMVNLSLQYGPILEPSYEPVFTVSIGFSASDLFRSTSKLSSTLAGEGLMQARAEVEKARQDIETKIEQTQRSVEGLLLSLSVGLNDFQLKDNQVEVERIRSSVGLANTSSIRVKELARYSAAFSVLQTLRELRLIALDLEGSGIKL
ncbi:MAG TPA: TolC family protein [Sphaerochaeta sp.]|nr:TolC family protein [Sphaerochaeta sp.]